MIQSYLIDITLLAKVTMLLERNCHELYSFKVFMKRNFLPQFFYCIRKIS